MASVSEFEDLRPYLFSLAYRMLGDAGEAEDVVQDAFVRWQSVTEEVDSAKAYLAKVTTRLCIDHLRSARTRRESYVGPWLPEPVSIDPAADPVTTAEKADSLSLAFLVVLESLNPIERAVFLLREVFEYDYREIAEVVDVTEVNARQIAHRAQQHIASRRPRFETSRQKQDEITYRFLEACAMGELGPLTEMLTEDVVLYSDGGGKAQAARRPIAGAQKVSRFLLGIVAKEPPGSVTRIVDVNGSPTIALTREARLTTVLSLDLAGDKIRGIHIVVNPDKLQRVRVPS